MKYSVQTEELESVIARMVAFEQHLDHAVDDADRRVQRMHVTWTGAAADAHQAAHARWKRDATAMREALARMRAIAATAHGNYQATVATNSSMWSGL